MGQKLRGQPLMDPTLSPFWSEFDRVWYGPSRQQSTGPTLLEGFLFSEVDFHVGSQEIYGLWFSHRRSHREYTFPEDIEYFRSMGAGQVLPKPVDLSDLEDTWTYSLWTSSDSWPLKTSEMKSSSSLHTVQRCTPKDYGAPLASYKVPTQDKKGSCNKSN